MFFDGYHQSLKTDACRSQHPEDTSAVGGSPSTGSESLAAAFSTLEDTSAPNSTTTVVEGDTDEASNEDYSGNTTSSRVFGQVD